MDPKKDALSILLVEDNPADVYLLKTALADIGIAAEMPVFGNGTEAWQYLHQFGADQDKPELIILDLNLPGMNGREILEEILKNSQLRDLPIAVFSGSCFESGVTEDFPDLRILFATKSYDYDELKDTLAHIAAFAENLPAR